MPKCYVELIRRAWLGVDAHSLSEANEIVFRMNQAEINAELKKQDQDWDEQIGETITIFPVPLEEY